MKIVNDISQMSRSDIISLAHSMQDVLEYNYQHLLNFDQYQVNCVRKQILKDLNLWFTDNFLI